ncbi:MULTISPECIES: hypothetical protein [unclassified Bradyrhizobium]|uniref:hypothetical protein n=1 Tax=unclassified Bradyrhizobium TaxID=2631580 RepID=UPI00247AC594|nr:MULTISPECIES: hypothetical protein [unclassified Bradyrhizobium]WGS18808.1 hypothetical protein MTX22_30430 [Bradyrhizobium sp. ISRA463]WGS25637.1 hypothetical protein MTX19_28010 [Bradyrhizobium sp. ISRA464]
MSAADGRFLQTFRLGTFAYGRYLATLLRCVVFIGEATLGAGLDLKRIRLGAVGGADQVAVVLRGTRAAPLRVWRATFMSRRWGFATRRLTGFTQLQSRC